MQGQHGIVAAVTVGLISISLSGKAQQSPQVEGQIQEQPPQQPRQLSQQGQDAVARLYALNQTRARYADLAAELADDQEAQQFLRQRAQDYRQSNERLGAFAEGYGVDVRSPQVQETVQETEQQWQRENQRIRQAEPRQSADVALDTFIERNEQAIDDLRQLRGEVQEQQLVELINQRIESLEQESSQAQRLKQSIQERQQQPQQQQQQPQQQQQQPQQQQPLQQDAQ